MDIAVVVLDTLRKDAFERHFDWLPGTRFENAWSPSHWTVPVHGAMFTGLYPSETGVHAKDPQLDCDRQVLAEQLSEAGYTTRAFSCNPYVSPAFGYDRGFEEFTGSWRLRQLDPELFDWNSFISETSDEGPTRYVRALYRCLREDCRTVASLNQGVRMKLRDWNYLGSIDDDGAAETLEYLEKTDFGSDEFLYLNLMEAHAPYDPPEAYQTVDVAYGPGLAETISGTTDESVDVETVEQAYDDCVRYLSDSYADIFERLTEAFDYVITLADHGECFGEHGAWMHGYGLYPELTNVPLSIYGPEMEADTNEELVSLLDIHGTVLDLTTGDESPRGNSILGTDPTGACLTEYHGFTALKLDRLGNAEIAEDRLARYDQVFRGIARGDDYGFETPDGFELIGDGSAADTQVALEELVETLDVRDGEANEQEVSDGVMDQLEDLGYA